MRDIDNTIKQKSPQIHGKKAKRPKAPVHTASAVLMSRLLDEQSNMPHQEHDELDRFFLSISGTVKKFSPYEQAVAKRRIFNLVSEMELKQLAPASCTNIPQCAYTPSPASTSSIQANSTSFSTSPEPWNITYEQLQ